MHKTDLELKKYEYKISASVNELDYNVRERFKAIAYVSDQIAELSRRYEQEAKIIEYNAQQADKPLYKMRALIIAGKNVESSDITISEFDKRFEEINDEVYDSIKISEFTNISDLANHKGIPEFWLKAMKNSHVLGTQITKNEENLLKHLVDIEHISVENSNDFILRFHFASNDYIQNSSITKRYIMNNSVGASKSSMNVKNDIFNQIFS